MKYSAKAIIILVLCGAAPLLAGQKIAVVDLEALVRVHPNTETDRQRLEQNLQGFEEEGERLQEHVEALRQAYEKASEEAGDAALSERARQRATHAAAESREAWIEAQQDFRRQMQVMQQRLTEQEIRLLNRTVAELRREIARYAEEAGIEIVFDSADRRSSTPGILFATEDMDITRELIERIKPVDLMDEAAVQDADPEEEP